MAGNAVGKAIEQIRTYFWGNRNNDNEKTDLEKNNKIHINAFWVCNIFVYPSSDEILNVGRACFMSLPL